MLFTHFLIYADENLLLRSESRQRDIVNLKELLYSIKIGKEKKNYHDLKMVCIRIQPRLRALGHIDFQEVISNILVDQMEELSTSTISTLEEQCNSVLSELEREQIPTS
jgi:hypothetical protein